MKRPARHRSSPMAPAKRLNPLAQQHRDPFSKHGLWRCECTESEQKSTKPLICVQRISMAVALGADPDFAKYFAKHALPARREKFPEISPVRLM